MAKAAEAALIDAATARALADGAHGDPFSVLGLHQRGKRWVLTAFVPGAERLEVLAETSIAASPVEAVPGLFTAILPGRQPYRLRAANGDTTWEFDDPFRFGPVLGELDEYLLGEGTHRRLWQVLGAHQIIHEGVAGTHFAVWAPNASAFRWWAISTSGMAAATRCAGAAQPGSGKPSFPVWAKGRPTNTNCAVPMAACCR
jgi:1,4-alpha-glucan branching enzyme